jgi:hypothetical protein
MASIKVYKSSVTPLRYLCISLNMIFVYPSVLSDFLKKKKLTGLPLHVCGVVTPSNMNTTFMPNCIIFTLGRIIISNMKVQEPSLYLHYSGVSKTLFSLENIFYGKYTILCSCEGKKVTCMSLKTTFSIHWYYKLFVRLN